MLNEYFGRWMLLGCTVTSLAGCGKEVARVPFAGEGTAAVTVPLTAGDVAFWTDLDLKYEGPAAMTYLVELEQGGASIDRAVCDPLGQMNMKLGWVETQLGATRSLSGSGRMACSAKVAMGGPTTVKATLAFSTRPTTLSLTKANLVIKQ